MGNEDFRRELNNAIDNISGSPSHGLRDRVRSRLIETPSRGGPFWIAGVATVTRCGDGRGLARPWRPAPRQ